MDQPEPNLIIVEAPKGVINFKYPGEGLPGQILAQSTTEHCPVNVSIKISNYTGPVFLLVSPVNEDQPFRQHPHKLIPRKNVRLPFINDEQDMIIKVNSNEGTLGKHSVIENYSASNHAFSEGLKFKEGTSNENQDSVRVQWQCKSGEYSVKENVKVIQSVRSTLIEEGNNSSDCQTFSEGSKSAPTGSVSKEQHIRTQDELLAITEFRSNIKTLQELPSVFKLNGETLLTGRSYFRAGVLVAHYHQDESTVYPLDNLGLVITLKKNIAEVLAEREEMAVDPFETGFIQAQDLSLVTFQGFRLCFQAVLPTLGSECVRELAPVVSAPIYDYWFVREERPRYKPSLI